MKRLLLFYIQSLFKHNPNVNYIINATAAPKGPKRELIPGREWVVMCTFAEGRRNSLSFHDFSYRINSRPGCRFEQEQDPGAGEGCRGERGEQEDQRVRKSLSQEN